MKRHYFPWFLVLFWIIPLACGAQSSVSVTATVLHDHFASQLSPGVQAWVDQQAAQLAVTGQFNAPALATEAQAHFPSQLVGTAEVQALTFVILVQAAKSAEAVMTNAAAQLALIESARTDAARKMAMHPRMISQNTVPNRTVVATATTNLVTTNRPATDPRTEARFYQDFIGSQVSCHRLAEALKYYQSQATELVNAHLAGLK